MATPSAATASISASRPCPAANCNATPSPSTNPTCSTRRSASAPAATTTRGLLPIGRRGGAGFSGDDTPVFERFFVGGTTTIRGFDFRNASPVELGTTVGGDFMLLGSVEYLLPITADDSFRMVFFVDTGTAERHVELHSDSYRVAPGFGLRISVPGMGPAPIALDFAWPVV